MSFLQSRQWPAEEGSERGGVRPPPGPYDPVVEETIEEFARDRAEAYEAAGERLGDPRLGSTLRRVGERVDRERMQPALRLALSKPEVFETYLAEVLPGEERGMEEERELAVQLGRAVDALTMQNDRLVELIETLNERLQTEPRPPTVAQVEGQAVPVMEQSAPERGAAPGEEQGTPYGTKAGQKGPGTRSAGTGTTQPGPTTPT